MACNVFSNTCPSPGDQSTTLLAKILQVINNGGGGGGVAGVSSISVNGGPAETGAVSLTIPSTLLNFTDENANADGVVWTNSGTTEIFRTVGATGFVQFQPAMRLHLSSDDSLFTLLGGTTKATSAFFEFYGQNHPTGIGGATVSIHNGGQFRVRSAPQSSTVSVLRLALDATTGFLAVGGSSSPAGLLHLTSDSTGQLSILEQASADTSAFSLSFRKARGTFTAPTVITTGDTLGSILFRGYSGAGGYVTGAEIRAVSEGTVATTRVPAHLSFWTGTDAAPTVLTEQARVTSGGAWRFGSGAPTADVPALWNTTGSRAVEFISSSGTGDAGLFLRRSDTAVVGGDIWTDGSTGRLYIDNRWSNSGGHIVFRVGTAVSAFQGLIISGTAMVGIGPSLTPGANLDINNSTTTTSLRLYHTTDGAASPANYSRLTLSHNAAGTGLQTANLIAETGGSGADDISIRLQPAGTGGLYLGPVADGTAVGGNARGSQAVDLQLERNANLQVASGLNSFIAGGRRNRVTGAYAATLGGDTCVASGSYAVALAGVGASASGTGSLAVGIFANATKYGQFAQASNVFAIVGDAQTSVMCARRQTTDGTANVELFLDGAAARCIIANNTSWTFVIYIVGRRTNGTERAHYKIEGGISNDAGTTAILGTAAVTDLTGGSSSYSVNAFADDANDALVVRVTGTAGHNVNWVARIALVETTG